MNYKLMNYQYYSRVLFADATLYYHTHLRPVSSFPKKWMTTVLKTKLENSVKTPVIPEEEKHTVLTHCKAGCT